VAAAPFDLTIGYSIDTLGRMLPVDTRSVECKPPDLAASASKRADCFGGIARRYTFAQQLRANFTNVLVLDAGNSWFGTSFQSVGSPPASNIGRWMATGAGSASAFYDAVSVSTADFFAPGPPVLADYLSAFGGNLPIVLSNMDWSADPNLKSVNILDFWVKIMPGGRIVGVIGAINTGLAASASPGPYVELLLPTVAVLNATVVSLMTEHPTCNIVVLLTSLAGLDLREYESVAKQVPGIDVVIYRSMHNEDEQAVLLSGPGGRPVVVATLQNLGGPSIYGGSMGTLQLQFDDDGYLLAHNATLTYLDDQRFPDYEPLWTDVVTEFAKVAALDGVYVGPLTQDYGQTDRRQRKQR
jgi:2',3'-cyclic-nucleotide 2'-phosphodiesterase (5'-nucleotidase family)